MGDGRWEMGDGRWEMGGGRWEMGDGRWEMVPPLCLRHLPPKGGRKWEELRYLLRGGENGRGGGISPRRGEIWRSGGISPRRGEFWRGGGISLGGGIGGAATVPFEGSEELRQRPRRGSGLWQVPRRGENVGAAAGGFGGGGMFGGSLWWGAVVGSVVRGGRRLEA